MKHREDIIKYIEYTIVMILLALSHIGADINAVHTGFYVALIFAGESPLIVSIIYILAGVIASPNLYTLIISIVPTFVMNITKLILNRMHRRMTIFIASLSGVISLLPILIISIIDKDNLISGLVTLVITTIFIYLSIVAVFALVVKKLRYRLSTDEIASFLVMFALMSLGLYNLDIYGFRVYYIVMSLGILLLISITELAPSMCVAIAYGIGASLGTHSLAIAGIIALMTLTSYTFIRYNRYFSVVSLVTLDLVGGTYFNAFVGYDYLHIIAVAVGVIIYLLIPPKYIVYYRSIYKAKGKSTALVDLVNRSRIDIRARIDNLAMLFGDIEREMTGDEYILTAKRWRECLSERVMLDVCADCANRDTCFRALGGDTIREIEPLIDKASITPVTRDDIGIFLESRCTQKAELIDKANSITNKYSHRNIEVCNVLDNKRILGEEIGSIGKVLSKLARSVLDGVSINSDIEQRIIEELNLLGIICHDVLAIERKDKGMELTLVVRDIDKDKRIIRTTLEKMLSMRLIRYEDRDCEIEGFRTIRFVPQPRYMLAFGTATETKEGSEASGDSMSVMRLDGNKVLVTLTDAKGSGELARQNSANTIGIIEKMYKAGFDSDTILSFANRLLSIRSGEDFSAVDMCIVDLTNGAVDFIKYGGVSSYIRRLSSVDVIEGSSLPLGVLDDARPTTIRRVLMENDIVVLVSDGITDSLGSDEIVEMLQNSSIANVDTLARDLLIKATEHGAMDDSTVLAIKLTKS